MTESKCEHCGKGDEGRPAIFKGERFCSDNCRKALGLESERQHNELHPPLPMMTELEKQLLSLVGYLVPYGRAAAEVPDAKTQIYELSLNHVQAARELVSTEITFIPDEGLIVVENTVK